MKIVREMYKPFESNRKQDSSARYTPRNGARRADDAPSLEGTTVEKKGPNEPELYSANLATCAGG